MRTGVEASGAAVMAPAGTWEIDPAHTNVEFAVRHLMIATVRGRFGGVSGWLTPDAAPGETLVDITIDASTVDTRESKRDAHLRSADFLDVEKHARIRFEGRRIEPGADGRFSLVGDLMIRGIRKEVVLDVEPQGEAVDPWGNERVGYAAKTRINRKDFGLEWNAALEAGGVVVGDEVKIRIDVEAIRQSS